MRTLVLLALALSSPALACQGKTGAASGPEVPRITAKTLAGEHVALDDLAGQVVLVNVWATWCAPCRQELPVLQKLHQRHAAEGFAVVGLSVDLERAEKNVRDTVRQFGLEYPIWLDPTGQAARALEASVYPTSVLFSRAGLPVWRRAGIVERDDPELATQLAAALAAPR